MRQPFSRRCPLAARLPAALLLALSLGISTAPFARVASAQGPSTQDNPVQAAPQQETVAALAWPSFRGPNAAGVAETGTLPAQWDVETGTHLRWRTEIPGLAHSSPIVWAQRLFVTTAVAQDVPALRLGDTGRIDMADDQESTSWRVLALDTRNGKILWQREVSRSVPRTKRHVKASQSNSTPATDGEILAVILGSEGLYAFDLDGKQLWHQDLGRLDPGLFGDSSSQWGYASSPIVVDDMVIVQVDRHADSFLAAYDRRSGEPRWKVAREERPIWATPTLYRGSSQGGGRNELIVIGGYYVRGYDPKTGKELWRFHDEAEVKTPTPFVAGDKIVLSGGYRGRPILALRLGGSGDLSVPAEAVAAGQDTNAHLLWRTERGGPYTSTPIVYRGHLYAVTDTGILSVYNLETGQRLNRRRTHDTYSASLVATDGKLYLTGENGTVTVIEAGTELEVLAENDMGEPCMATPAIVHGTLYFRCRSNIYAVGE